VRVGAGVMFDIEMEIELLERCAAECALISGLATDTQARAENGTLASEYKKMVQDLKSHAVSWATSNPAN
jgi:hypothetical protein